MADPATVRRWLLVAVLAAAAAVLTSSVIGAAESARARWDDTRPVVVAAAPIAGGAPVAHSLRISEWPSALAPDGAFGSFDEIGEGTRAAGPLSPGTPLTRAATSGPGTTGDDLRRIALPRGSAPLPVSSGDPVDVWATYDPSLAGSGLQSRRVAAGAEVVTADDQVVVVAVDPEDAPDLTEAVALATLTLVGVG